MHSDRPEPVAVALMLSQADHQLSCWTTPTSTLISNQGIAAFPLKYTRVYRNREKIHRGRFSLLAAAG
ncbi:hypothetical protein A3197_06655 [Candidatus Thiodiazotropha endoloripes]|nr:hypothetical protein A3197_06655 [Candidatus Thiodiazotropha endoloripes]